FQKSAKILLTWDCLFLKKVKSQQQTEIVKKYMTIKPEELNNILINKSTGAKSYFCGINYFGFGALDLFWILFFELWI
ncbi:MAG: hypothetical protein ACOCVX_01935, partial [Bacteroidales bacterium]